jgi:hypothetical protein
MAGCGVPAGCGILQFLLKTELEKHIPLFTKASVHLLIHISEGFAEICLKRLCG